MWKRLSVSLFYFLEERQGRETPKHKPDHRKGKKGIMVWHWPWFFPVPLPSSLLLPFQGEEREGRKGHRTPAGSTIPLFFPFLLGRRGKWRQAVSVPCPLSLSPLFLEEKKKEKGTGDQQPRVMHERCQDLPIFLCNRACIHALAV